MKRPFLLLPITLLAFSFGCSQADKEQAKHQTAEVRHEAHKLATEAREDARKLGHNIDAAVKPDTQSADEKLADGTRSLQRAGTEAATKIDHAALLAKVKARLASEAGLSTVTTINVDSSGSVVTLRGTVGSAAQKEQAEHAASQVDGVTRVVNLLQVQAN